MPRNNKIDLEEIYAKNKLVWRDTYKYAEQYDYKSAIKITNKDLAESDFFDTSPNEISPIKHIGIYNNSTLEVAITVAELGLKPLVINASNENYPIENVNQGLVSTECDLFRYTNLSACITESNYPLYDLDMLYVPTATIFKTIDNRRLTNSARISMLFVPPVRRPNLLTVKGDKGMEELYSNKAEETKMISKIENMFRIAQKYKYRAIIIPAFGCPDANPVQKIIEFFNEAVQKYPVKYIFYAIKTNENPFETTKTKDEFYGQFNKGINRIN